MIRLRQRIELGLRHPLWGPLVIVFVALMLAFVVMHTIEHGVEGIVFACVVLAATSQRVVVVGRRLYELTPLSAPGVFCAGPLRL